MGGVRKMEGSIQCMLLWEEQRLEVNQVLPGNQGAEKRWSPGVSAWGIEDDGLGGVLGEFWINLLRHDVSDYSVVRMFLSVTHCAVSAGSVVVFFFLSSSSLATRLKMHLLLQHTPSSFFPASPDQETVSPDHLAAWLQMPAWRAQ